MWFYITTFTNMQWGLWKLVFCLIIINKNFTTKILKSTYEEQRKTYILMEHIKVIFFWILKMPITDQTGSAAKNLPPDAVHRNILDQCPRRQTKLMLIWAQEYILWHYCPLFLLLLLLEIININTEVAWCLTLPWT